MRRYKTYAPCELDAATGAKTVPTVTQYGDGLCDPGLTAHDIKAERVYGVVVNTTVPLTRVGPYLVHAIPLVLIAAQLPAEGT